MSHDDDYDEDDDTCHILVVTYDYNALPDVTMSYDTYLQFSD